MPGTAEQSLEVNMLDSSWTSEVFSWFKFVGLILVQQQRKSNIWVERVPWPENPASSSTDRKLMGKLHPAERPVKLGPVDRIDLGQLRPVICLDLGEIKMHLPEEDFSWSSTLRSRRVSARKCAQADLSGTAHASSNKRQKKLEDPLAGWVMPDPDTGEKLTGHEWVKRYPEEFTECYSRRTTVAKLSTLHRRKLIRRLHQ
ncbi:hypothetical protein DFH08DRAFT_817781 [Mycena albidolilacea]|uniref:Uncharacterized protein n=1 Tax=Mycena albidolilacea TaxID=1033008 RepID=A0AAD6ZIL8_9AGAR|nr:hypothetical protein DFH08DRAFT_817781 [Mycena albidolilacea]